MDLTKCCTVRITSCVYEGGLLVVAAPGIVADADPRFSWFIGREWPQVKAWFKSRLPEFEVSIEVLPGTFEYKAGTAIPA